MGILHGKRGLIMGVANEKSQPGALLRWPQHKGLTGLPIRLRVQKALDLWRLLLAQTSLSPVMLLKKQAQILCSFQKMGYAGFCSTCHRVFR